MDKFSKFCVFSLALIAGCGQVEDPAANEDNGTHEATGASTTAAGGTSGATARPDVHNAGRGADMNMDSDTPIAGMAGSGTPNGEAGMGAAGRDAVAGTGEIPTAGAGGGGEAGMGGSTSAGADSAGSGGTTGTTQSPDCNGDVTLDSGTPSDYVANVLACETIDGSLFITFGGATAPIELRFPNLTSVTGHMRIDNNTHLSNIVFSKLTDIGEEFYVADNNGLTSISVPAVLSVQRISISRNANLSSVVFPVLRGNSGIPIDDIMINANPILATVDFPTLETVVLTFTLLNNPLLVDLFLPRLKSVGTFRITGTTTLTYLNVLKLTQVREMCAITMNTVLPVCQAEQVCDQAVPPPPVIVVMGNQGICNL